LIDAAPRTTLLKERHRTLTDDRSGRLLRVNEPDNFLGKELALLLLLLLLRLIGQLLLLLLRRHGRHHPQRGCWSCVKSVLLDHPLLELSKLRLLLQLLWHGLRMRDNTHRWLLLVLLLLLLTNCCLEM